MAITGGCYCGDVRYEADGEPIFRGQCHCRECQYISGGHPNVVLGLPEDGFRYTGAKPRTFSRDDLDNPVTREFCERCGTHILTRAPALPGALILKVGTLDDPSMYEGPDQAIFTIDAQSFHHIPEGIPTFERLPG